MKQEGLATATTRRRHYRSHLEKQIAPRKTSPIETSVAAAPNEKGFTDIAGFEIRAGNVYLSPLIDCFDGLVVSWPMGARPSAELVTLCSTRPSGQ